MSFFWKLLADMKLLKVDNEMLGLLNAVILAFWKKSTSYGFGSKK